MREWTNKYFKSHNNYDRAYAFLHIRNHTIELARDEITRDTNAIRDFFAYPEEKAKAKESVLLKLKRLLLGESSGINAMKNGVGATVTDPVEIASVLKQHWEKVFKDKQVDSSILEKWMEEFLITKTRALL